MRELPLPKGRHDRSGVVAFSNSAFFTAQVIGAGRGENVIFSIFLTIFQGISRHGNFPQ